MNGTQTSVKPKVEEGVSISIAPSPTFCSKNHLGHHFTGSFRDLLGEGVAHAALPLCVKQPSEKLCVFCDLRQQLSSTTHRMCRYASWATASNFLQQRKSGGRSDAAMNRGTADRSERACFALIGGREKKEEA